MKHRHPRGQSGSSLTLALGFAAFVGFFSLGIIEMSERVLLDRRSEVAQLDAQYANERALTMAGYLISNNLIICRNANANSPDRCEWAGQYHLPNPLPENQFGLSKASVDSKGALSTVLDIPDRVSGIRMKPTSLKFQLSNFGKDLNANSKALELVGRVPNEAATNDDDWWIVIVEAATEYKEGNGQTKKLTTIGGIRRPLGSPILDVAGSPTCQFSCKAGDTVSPNPDCKGPQIVLPIHKDVDLDLVLLNLGPGALISTAYERTVTYEPTFYPSMTGPVISAVPILAATEKPLMPLQKKLMKDKFVCETPEVFQAATADADNQQFMTLFRYSYTISVSRFDMTDPKYLANRAAFLAQYDPFNPATYKPNPSLSAMEPKKAGGSLAPLDSNLVRLPPILAPQADTTTAAGGGDGDGGGGGN
jgi:hypothetical protein